jgi:GlpG protein
MRLIGHLQNETSAKTLGDYLVSLDIRNMVEPDGEGWAVWIYSEDQIEAGRQALTNFLSNPTDAKYQKARQAAAAVEEKERRDTEKSQKRVRTPDRIWAAGSIGPVTAALIGLSVVATLLIWAYPNAEAPFMISNFIGPNLLEVRHGQVWRLITPIFLHSTVLHIFFNMWWLRDLGTQIELRRGSKNLAALVLLIAIGSNLGQYYYSGPSFGGMSGVVYGLLGYIWMRGHADPSSGLYLPPSTIGIMLIWFFLCLFNVLGPVANACHAVGLVMGMIIGAIPISKRFL